MDDAPPDDVEYREVPGLPGYLVGDDGSAWTLWMWQARPPRLGDEWKRLRPARQRGEVLAVAVRRPGEPVPRRVPVAALVLLAFAGPPPPGLAPVHANGDPADCRPANLAYGPPPPPRHPNPARGGRKANAVLTEATVREVKRRLAARERPRDVAREFGLAPSVVSAIGTGRSWGWVE